MEYQIVTLFIIAILNAVLGYFIIRGKKDLPNIFFSLVALSVSLWSLNLAFFIKSIDFDDSLIFANLYYIFAATIPLFFLYFSLTFLNNKNSFSFRNKGFLFSLPILFLTITIALNKNFLIKKIFLSDINKDVVLNKPAYILYGAYFIFFVLLSYFILGKKLLKTNDLIEKVQLKFIIFGTAISYSLGMFFNLILPWLSEYRYIWLGPPFTLIMILSIGYSVIKHHLFSKKVITAEILTFILIFFVLVRTIISETLQEQIINSLLLLIVSILGILLVKSVIEEVESREQIQKLADGLKHANAKLKKMDEQKSEFINIASHQLRGPIASLKGYSSMILEGSFGKISDGASEATKRIFQSSQALALIVDDFLNLSRIERNKIEFSFAIADIKDVVEKSIQEIKPIADDKKIKLSFTSTDNNFNSNVDAEKIKQVVSNIIDNAVKYTPEGWVNVELTKKENKILLKISDSGIGLPRGGAKKLFKKFSRLENANSANIKGTGLGLYLAKKIIDAHHGKISVESKGEGKGTTFFVEFKGV